MRVGLEPDGPVEPGFRLEHLRQEVNAGGSGGYNAGLRRALEYALPPSATDSRGEPGHGWVADFVWMVDSDVRLAPDTLALLLTEMERNQEIVAAGSTLVDPLTGQGFELGGHVNRKSGWWEPHAYGVVGVREIVQTDYLAACCALVRAEAIRMTGVMPDNFLHGDDVEWTRRMQDITGGKVVCVPWAFAMHPHFSRFATWTRYYTGRSAFGTLEAVNRGFKVRLKRAFVEVRRAVQQALNDREDLARLHVRALLDASRGVVTGKAADGVIDVIPAKPFKKLSEELGAALESAGLRDKASRGELRVRVLPTLLLTHKEEAEIFSQLATLGVTRHDRQARYHRSFAGELWDLFLRTFGLISRPDLTIAPARGQAYCWLSAPVVVQVWTGSFVVRRPERFARIRGAIRFAISANWAALRAAMHRPPAARMYPGRLARPATAGLTGQEAGAGNRLLRVAAVVLGHSRPEALRATLRSLTEHPLFAQRELGNSIVVIDNGSTVGLSLDELGSNHGAAVHTMRLDENMGVEGFNRGVKAALEADPARKPDLVLILDDDARVESRHLSEAVALMSRRDDLGAVTFHPRNPDTAASEWAFADQLDWRPTDRWPVMGCANLVRADVWERLGGYEPTFFLYRNDTDLALRILRLSRASADGAGHRTRLDGPTYGVYFDPRWVAWHDTPAGADGRKSARWHKLATRNWVWTCRRNARATAALRGAAIGWAWAHRLAGLSPRRHAATLAGAISGFLASPAKARGLDNGTSAPDRRDDTGLKRLIGLQVAHRRAAWRERRAD
jgi:GT2 family glycosyltransferase